MNVSPADASSESLDGPDLVLLRLEFRMQFEFLHRSYYNRRRALAYFLSSILTLPLNCAPSSMEMSEAERSPFIRPVFSMTILPEA